MDRDNDATIVNTHFRQTLLAINQVLGDKAAMDIYFAANLENFSTALLADNMGKTFNGYDYARILETIEITYGDRGPRILRRIGKESFHIVLREQPGWMNTGKRVFKLWSPNQRSQFMLEAIVESQQKIYPNHEIWMEEKNGELAYIEQNCLVCYGRKSSHPVCHLTIGFIKEAIHWASDVDFEVRETSCTAMEDAYCRFVIAKSSATSQST
jgi:predicted hydrocarbon binding protein